MKSRIITATLSALLLCQCQTTDQPPAMPPQEMPETPLAPGETKRVFMTREDHEYIFALLEPLMESESDIVFYDKELETATDTYPLPEPMGSLSPTHFRVLATCPNKVYSGELSDTFTDYFFYAYNDDSVYRLTISLSSKHEHGIRVGGIAISSPTFHHFLQTIIRKKKAEQAAAEAQAKAEAEAKSEAPLPPPPPAPENPPKKLDDKN